MPVMKELTLLFSKGIGGFSKDTVKLSKDKAGLSINLYKAEQL